MAVRSKPKKQPKKKGMKIRNSAPKKRVPILGNTGSMTMMGF